jgi:hypothetical protein
LYRTLKIAGYLVLVLMASGIAYAAYIGLTHFPGIGV